MDRAGQYVMLQLGRLAFLLLVMAFVTFMLLRLGGAPPVVMLGGSTASVDEVAQLRADYGLDQPVPVQFIRFVLRIAQGDLGRSWLTGNRVAAELFSRLPATLELMLYGIALGGLIGVPLGIAAGFGRGRAEDHAVRGFALLVNAIPGYFLSLALLMVFFSWLDLAPPPTGRISLMLTPPDTVTGSYFIDAILIQNAAAARSALGQLALPVMCIAVGVAGSIILRVRAAMLAQLDSDHLAFAHAQGLPGDIVSGIALRGAAPAIAIAAGSEFAGLFGATAVVEYVFSWGGMGQFGLEAIVKGDFAVVQGFVLLTALFALLVLATGHLLARAMARGTGRS